ncbi:MAG: DUF4156 domain-containing protein [Mariprofundus sp.]
MKKISWLLCIAVIVLGGCSPWVEPTSEALNVRVAYLSQINGCKKLGRVTVSVLDEVAFISRSEEDMSEELETLGRNSAAEMKGDTIVAMSKIVDGEQTFDVYRCK